MFSVLRHSATAWTLALISVAQFTSASVGASDHQPRLGAVSSENAVCSQIGINLLKAGGNAADAMVGTVICVGVVAMAHSGIGGGGFMIIRSSNGSYEYIDFREMAGQAAFEEMYTNNTEASLYGGLAT